MSDSRAMLTESQRTFITASPLFFVATAAAQGPIGLGPRAGARLRLLGPDLVGYLDADGADDETQAHLAADGRIALLFCTAEPAPMLLRLHGRARIIRPSDDEWDFAERGFDVPPGDWHIVLMRVERVEESAAAMPMPAASRDAVAAPGSARHVEVEPDWVPAVLNFWLTEVGPEGWFDSTEEMDVRLTHMFRALWEAQRDKPVEAFLDDADTALAALILFDQFPRNMFRGEARAFATDPLALEIARAALDRGFDQDFVEAARPFFYMPFMHSESLADQERSLELFSQPGFEFNLRFAVAHHAVIARFGRFPHRNKALGRETLPEEEEAVEEGSGW